MRQITNCLFGLGLLLISIHQSFAQNTLNLAGLSASSTSTVAYSLRRLSTGYTGNLIEVRRSSDNTTANIGYDGSGNLDVAALTTFVGAGDGFIRTWYDQSGNANNGVQFSNSLQPQIVSSGTVLLSNSRPVIRCNGTTYIDGGTSSYGITGAHTLNAIYNFQSGTVQHIIDRVLTGGGNPLTSITGSNQGQYRNDAGTLQTVGSTQSPPFSNIFTATWDASNNINHYKNGVVDYTGTLSLPATLDIMRIGMHFSITGTAVLNFWEVIMFPSAISNSERLALEANQFVYYNFVPAVTAVTPLAGDAGTAVSVTGTNFNATSSNNIVYFGATKATVTSATTTSLNVTVPVGSTFSPVTVQNTNYGFAAFSQYAHMQTYNNAAFVSGKVNFDPKVDITAGNAAQGLVFADIDGDGKADMIAVNSASNNAYVYRNISSSGSLTTGSFAAPVTLTTAAGPLYAAVADIDGDGKRDIIVSNSSANSISVFRNTSTSGSISLSAKVDFTTATAPNIVATGDIDGDGRPDVTVGNGSSSVVSVFRNTSVSGTISLAAKVDFSLGGNTRMAALRDIDGDGKQDMIAACNSCAVISIFRNIATPGSISSGSFATKVDFTTGTSPREIAVSDIDGDGKPDVVVTNTGSNSISVFRNLATSGSITTGSLSAKTDFTTANAPRGLDIGDIDGDGKPDVAVACGSGNSIAVFRNTATSGTINSGSFAARVDFPAMASGSPDDIAVGDLDGDGRADVAAANSTFSATVSVFRNNPLQPVTGTLTVCAGSTTTLSSGTGNGVWSSSNTGIATVGSASGVVTGVSGGTVTITYAGSAGTSFTNNYITTTVTVNTVSGGSNVGICPGGSTSLTASGSSTYTWAPATGLSATTGSSVTATPTITTTYSVTGTGTGCTNTATVTVSINPLPSSTFTVTPNPVCVNNAATFVSSLSPCSGNALTFNGSTSSASKGSVVTTAVNNITIEAWVNWSGTVSHYSFVFLNGNSALDGYALIIPPSSNQLQILIGNIGFLSSSATLTSGWHHVAIVRNAGTWSLYLDGTQYSVTSSGTAPNTPSADFKVGNSQVGTEGFNGSVDDVTFWNVARSTGQIQSDMQSCNINTQANLLGYWKFNEGSGATTADASGNGGTLSLSSASWVASPSLSTYAWSFGDGSTSTANNVSHTYTAAATYTPTFTVTDANGCTSSATQSVTVNAFPVVAAITGNTTLSTAITTTLASTTGGGVWTSAATGIATIGSSTGVVTGVSAGTALISYTVTTSGCSTTVTTNVTVNTPANALAFDGTNDYVVLPTGLTASYTDFTFEAWVYPTSNTAWRRIMDFGSGTTVNMFLTSSYNGAGIPRFAITTGGTAGEQQLTSSTAMPLNTWSHIAVTINGATNTGTLYLNGNVVATNAGMTLDPSSLGSLSNNWLGRSQYADPYFIGRQDEVRIWNIVRSQAQIQADMNCDVAQQANLVAYYRFNQGAASGTNTALAGAFDYSGNGNCGTLTNFALTGSASNYVTGAVGGCNTISDATPGAFSGNTPVCTGATITLGNANTGGTWSTASGNITINSTSGLVTGVTAGTATVTYTLNCNTSTLVVTINATPVVAAITGNTTLSTAITTTLASTTGGGVWTSAATGIATIGSSTGVVTGVSAGTALISYTVTTSGCSTTVTTNVTVNTPQNALLFDGADDRVLVNNGKGYDLSNKSFTIEFWAKRNGSGADDMILGQGTSTSSRGLHIGFNPINVMRFGFFFDDLDASSSFVDNNWHHWAFTFDDATRQKIIYRDGVQVASGTASGHFLGNGSSDLYIGDTWSGTSTFNGHLDELRIWSTIRSQAQVAANMNCDITQQAGLQAYYRFNQGTASGTNTGLTCAFDYSGNNHPGTITNFALSGGSSNYVTGAVGTCNTATPIAPGSFSGNTPVCVGQTITLSNANTGGTWSTASSNVTVNSTTGVVTGVISGTTATVNYTLNCSTSSVTVTVNPAPAITSVTPLVGYPASSVSIVGANFDATTTNNIVYFGATRATVAAATTTTLTVTVPTGATFAPVTVETTGCGLIGYAQYPYLPSFNNSAFVANTVNFNSAFTLAAASNPRLLAIGDIDGDGKSDLVVANNGGSANSVSVFRNISSSGSLSSGSFAAKVDFSVGNTPLGVAIADIDGDGKPEVLTASQTSNNFTVLRNTSSSGTISFAAQVNFTANAGPATVNVADIDLDGKADVIIANNSAGNVSVFRNTSSSGSISFATKVDFTTAANSYHTPVTDIDGDGKPDMVVANAGGSTISVFRNTSTPGTITSGSFAAKVDFSVSVPWGFATGDIDGDGKPDFVAAKNGSAQVAVLRNTSSSGSVSFASEVAFTCGSNPQSVALGDIDGDGKLDVISSSNSANRISVFRNIATSGTITSGSLAAKVDFAVGSAPEGVSIGDLDGDGKADLVVANGGSGNISVLRNNPLSPITGTTTVCASSTTTLGNATAGGIWVSGATGTATVNSTSGMVTGVAAGSATISYVGTAATVSADNIVTVNVTVNIQPTVAAITGTTTLTVYNTTTLANATPSGVWTSAATGTATINSASGIVTGVAEGIAQISYTVTNGFGCSATATTNVTVSGHNGIKFDGTNDYMIMPDIHSAINGTSVTVELWFRANAAGVIVNELGSPGVGSGWHDTWIEVLPTGEVKVRVWSLGSVSLGTVSFGTWHHVALRHNATTNRLDGLLDGVPSSGSSSGARSTSGAVFLTFGIADGQNLGSGAYFNGTIDEVRIWNRALCDGEIANNMAGRLNGAQTGLVAYYTLDQGIGGGTNTGLTTAIDYSGNGRNATLNNIALTGTSSNWVTGTVNALAPAYSAPVITASSNVTICNGSNTTLTASGGTSYRWTPSAGLSVTTGSSVTASPSSTITYTVTDECGGTATVQVSVNPTPTTSGGSSTAICIGSSTSLTASGASTYTWAPSATLSASTGTSVTATPTVTTIYTVTGTNAVGCSSNATVTVTVNPYSAVYSLTGGGPYCAGTAGSTIGLSGSDVGINYQLYKGGSTIGSPVAGTGSAISFGALTLTGTYTIVAIGAPSPGCTNSMTGSTFVSILTSPAAVSVLGGGAVCGGGPGVSIGLGGSAVGIDYQLYLGATPVGSPVVGVGTSLSFGSFTTLGTYTVVATNPINGCFSNMTGSAVITAASGITAFAMTGGGSYCTGGSGVNIGLAGSTSGLNYQLFLGTTAMGSAVAGTGSAISFGLQTFAGTYTVVGTNTTTGCFGNMTGSVTVSIDPLPNIYTVTGGGAYCAGGAGMLVGLSLSDAGVNYQLYNGASPVGIPVAGTGAAISFGAQTAAGTYTVVATDGTTTCTNTMGGSVAVIVNTLPTVTTGAGVVICAGSPTGLTAGGAVNYAWSPATALTATTGSSVTANPTTTTTYTITGTDANGCVNTAAVTVTVNPIPTVSGGSGVAICAGSSTGLTASGALTYTWSPSAGLSATTGASVTATPAATTTYSVTGIGSNGCLNTATVTVTVNAIPTVSAGPGATICAGLNTTLTGSGATTYTWAPGTGLSASTGVSVTASPTVTTTYTVTGTDAIGCANTALVTVSVNPTPNDYAVTGGGSFCSSTSGTAIGLAGSDPGVNYQLYTAGLPVGSPVAGTGAAISFGLHTASGVYTVVATNATSGCAFNISGSTTLTSYTSPAPITMTGGGAYCSGGTGVSVGLAGSAAGVNYQLYLGGSPVGSPVAGIGMGFSFGLQTTAGTYTAVATNVISGCTTNMTGTAVITVYSALSTHTVTGGGNYCSGGSGVAVALNGSDLGVNYQLYRGGLPLVGTTLAGTGSALSFGTQTTAGVYTVVATHATNGCTANMTGSATVTIDPLPTVYTVTGGGSYCTGGTGMAVGLSSSDAGIDYQLYLGASPVGSPVSGTGSAISFGTQSTAGIYTVVATNTSTGCVNNMTGSATIAIYTLPPVYIVSGGGSYCSGPGLHIYLGGSGGGTNYQLFNGATPVGSPVAGTGAYIDFGAFTTPGTYTVVATNASTSCSISMTGSATITGISLPTAYNVTGGGSYCSGGIGMAVGLSNSDPGINYQLYRGATAVGSAVAGTGSAISFGLHTTAGTYTVVATNASLGCTGNMTGSAVIIVNPLPALVTMTGGGAYCTGGTGVSIGLSGSAAGIDYQLYLGATPVGSAVTGIGTALSFGTHTTAGTYTAVATNTVTACASNMSGSAVVTINPLPTVYTVTGGGSYCSGSTGLAVGLSGSQAGVSYQLYNGASTVGSPVSGTGSAVTFGIQTAAGTYTVVATNVSTGCFNNMTGSATITINALPTVYTVTGGGAYCVGSSGSAIGLSGSDAGIDYRLYNGSSAVGSPVAGTGSALSFGTYTVATTYTVTATNTVTGCSSNMSGSASITINSLPAPVSVTGGGTICIGGTGVAVGLAASASGISYQLYVDGTPAGSPVTGVGGSLSFGLQTAIGTYTATGTHPVTGCSNNMTGSVIISNYTPPTAFAVTGGGSYCTGGTGVVVGLAGSATGVTYQLYRGATAIGSPVTGTGAALSFGLHTTAGTYTVVATTTSNGCTGNMTGSAVISLNPLPSAYTVTGGGSYCSGGTGVSVGISNSDIGTNYQLYNGVTPVGSAVAGTGAALSFGLQSAAGTYTVAATIAATSCSGNMTGSAVISIDPLPTAYTVTGGGSYCSGPGVHVYLSNSTAGVNYQLYRGATPVGSPVAGTGAALDFGGFTALGTYTVVATNATTACVNNMSGSAVISGFALPAIYTVTGGGGYCSGGTGAVVGLSNSDLSVDYQLYLGATPVGSTVAGTGSAISFGPQSTIGTYTVLAINSGSSCTSNMTGSATVSITALPTAYTVTGGGSYCLGGTGVAVGLSSSASGVSYQLYNGVTTMGSPVAGTGSAISFGLQTVVGTYTVVATDGTTTCTNNMTGSATISTIGLPTAYTVTGGGSYCAGGTGATISLSGSQTGVNYQLFNGVTSVGSPVAGTGSALSFGLHTSAGTYTVVATNTSTTCSATMTGSVAITTLALPTAYAFTGGGGYCSGGSGVTLGLAGSDIGISYQLYLGTMAVGSALSGTGSALSFGTHTVGGTYTVLATNTVTGCTASIGSTTITVYALPGATTVSGGGAYCSGGTGATIWLPGSGVGVNYQLFLGATPVGSPVAGVGTYLSLGTHTTTGTYTVVATNTTTGCTNNMTGSATISIHAPLTTYTVTGGGSYCTGGTGVVVGLSGSATGVEYKAYRDGLPLIGSVSGTGSAISFGLQTTAGTYTVVATNTTTTCTLNMSGSAVVSVDALPTAFTVTGGGSYCTGGTGVAVGLSSSTSGVNYQLYRGTTAVGSPVAGTGSAISFGLQTTAGTYTATATNTTSGCFNNMSGSVSVGINSLPPAYTVSGGGSYCAGGATGPNIYLSACSGLTTYQLWLGATPVGSPVAATGGSINFGSFTTVGTYSVTATSTLTGCTNNMTGSATISTIPLPTVYTVTGGGSYCTGGTGVAIGLSASNTGISYQLYRGATAIGAAVTGTGSALSFGVHTVAGTYTVVATVAGTFCTSNMSGSAVVAVNPLPAIFSVTGGGSYCSGGTGVTIGLSSSVTGTNYQLYRAGSTVGSPVAGTGSAISFGLQTTAGTYTVVATTAATGCVSNMTGSATVSVNTLPTVYTVTGGGSYCTGGTGVLVGLSGSQTWTSYQLYLSGSPVGSAVWGTGAAISFGLKTAAGTYTVVATNASSCTSNMTGSATVSVNPLPTDYTVTGGGSYCAGGTGVAVGLSSSQSGVNYQLYRSTSAVGSPVAGTGSAISFGLQTIAGTYTVKATSASTGCFVTMTGSATVTISAAPTVCSMTGGGSYCSGGTGVAVGLSASISGVTYQLYLSGSPVGSSLSGTGAGLSFGLQTTAGTYTAVATNGAGCTSNMSGSATVVVNALPTAYTVTGGGSYCSGGTGVNIYLSGSASGVAYRVFLSGSPVTSYIYGTGSALNFGKYTAAGTYTVQAVTLTTGCVATMTGSATVTINPIPTITGSHYTVAPGSTRTLTGTPSGGVWTTTAPSVATIGSSSGIVTGVALGSTYVYYTVSGCLGYRLFSVTPTGLREAAPDTTTSTAAVFKGGNIYIAPNPTRGMFMIRGSIDAANAPDAVTLDVTNMLGQVIHSSAITPKDGEINQEVQLPSSLANGMYIVTLRAGGESKVFHLVVER